MSITFGSIFSGIAGWDLGLERAGLQCRWMVEIDPVCRSVLARHWPDVARFEDVCQVGAHNLPPVDVLVFSAPCQDLSVAGKRAGLDGARSGLYFEAIRICRELRPALALFEQVPGLLSSHGGRDFGRALDALADIGALDIGWTVLDARWFGVPQRRRRLFVVSDFIDRRASQVLALADGLSGHPAPGQEARQAPAASPPGGAGNGGGYSLTGDAWWREGIGPLAASDDNGSNHVVASAITASAGHHGHSSPRGDGSDYLIFESRYARNGRGAPEAVCPPLKAQSGQTGKGDSAPLVFQQNQRNEVRLLGGDGQQAGALPAQPGMKQQNYVANTMTVRRLTPVECEKLMALPPGWTEYGVDGPIADSHRYRMLGNAVVANVAEWIGRRLVEALS